jgi:predicted permease
MQIQYFFRNLARNKTTSVINVFGLAVGVAAVLLIYRIVHYELSFNKNFDRYDRIARIVRYDKNREGEDWMTCVPTPAGNAIRQSVPQFEEFARAKEVWPGVAVPNPGGGAPQKKFSVNSPEIAFFTEPSFFKIFNLTWLAGDAKTALQDIGTVVLSKTLAQKCFGSPEAAMGETLVLDNVVTVTVRGVVNDLPANCDFPLSLLISWPTLTANPSIYYYDEKSWSNCGSNNQAYALLKAPPQWDAAAAVLAKVGEKEYAEERRNNPGVTEHRLQPLSDLHYNADLYNSGFRTVTKNRLKVLSFIGLMVLAMACFNFINLSTAMATERAKEVGVRKTLGSSRGQLVRQFMGETAAVTAISMLLGLNLATFCLPLLKHISDVPAGIPFLTDARMWAFFLVTGLMVTLLAGFYPALVLAGFDPVKAFKSKAFAVGNKRDLRVRQGLVVLQFSIAAALITGAIVTLGQLDYIRKKDLGFDKNLIYTFYLQNDSLSVTKFETLRQRLLQLPAVERLSFSSDHPASDNTWDTGFSFPTGAEEAPFSIGLKFADPDYRETYGLRLLAGAWYQPCDTIRQGVVNQTFLKKMGIGSPEEVIGHDLKLAGGRLVKITGVVEDFHAHSLHQPITPILITTRKNLYFNAGVKIHPDDLAVTTAAIQKTFDEVYPEQVFTGRFYDERIARLYEDENRFSNTCKGFAGLAVLIACLGLFGLSIHAAARRTKEIGIRKVLGASAAGLVGLLSKDFLKLVIVALLIASPLAYFFMEKWLQDFAYRIDIQWTVFALAGVVAVAVAFLTVSFQSVKAALANPVKSLRSE